MRYNTEKKNGILSFFKENCGKAFTVEELCDNILENGRGKSTVYRLVSAFVEEGVLQRITDARTRRVTYQYIRDGHCKEHLHLKCKGCGRLIHLDHIISEALGEKILCAEGFMLDNGALLYGTCSGCIAGAERSEI